MVLYLTGKKTNQMTAEAVIVILYSIKKRNPYLNWKRLNWNMET